MNRLSSRVVLFLVIASVAFALPGCSKRQPDQEVVARVNDDAIDVAELREFLGVQDGATSDAGITEGQKKEALDRLIAGRLLARDARDKGLENTDEYRETVKENERGALITALLRREVASKGKVSEEEVDAEAKKMKANDNTLSDGDAKARARRLISQANLRKVQENLIDDAQKEFPSTIHQEVVDRIGKGEALPDDAVLANAAGDNVTYGAVKQELEKVARGMPGGQDIASNPVAVTRMLKREVMGKSLVAYAKKQGIEGSRWHKITRDDIERTALIDLAVAKIAEGEAPVRDEEVDAYYKENPGMFAQHGKAVPLAKVREQLRGFLQNEKRKSAINAYIEELKKKAKITVNEKVLGEV